MKDAENFDDDEEDEMRQKKAKTSKPKRRPTVATREHAPSRPRESRSPLIEIDMDKTCSECGAKGAAPNGRCLKCIGKAVTDRPATEKQEWQRLPLVEEVVRELIKKHHHHLERAMIVVLGKPTASVSGGKTNVAKAKRAMPALNALVKDEIGEISYIIEVGLDAWDALDQQKRRIVLDHALMHFTGLDDESGTWGLVVHDIECFTAEIQRYGAWNEDLRGFVAAIKQQSLFKD